MVEEDGRNLMLLVGHVNLDLVRAVGLELAGVAPQVNWIDAGQESELPLVVRTSLFNVIDVAETLQMFVGFTVKLKVSFQVGSVVTEVAQVVAANDNGDLVFSGSTSVV